MSYDFSEIHILVVEDNKPMALLIQSLLYSFGFEEVELVADGNAAFASFCKRKHDIIITDWMMEPVDGISLSRLLRNNPKSPNQFVPILLVTGFGEKHRVFQARDAGITEFLVKPFNARDLYRRIAQMIEKPRQFVRSESFFGPDRRRKNSRLKYKGPLRRASDRKSSGSGAESRARGAR